MPHNPPCAISGERVAVGVALTKEMILPGPKREDFDSLEEWSFHRRRWRKQENYLDKITPIVKDHVFVRMGTVKIILEPGETPSIWLHESEEGF